MKYEELGPTIIKTEECSVFIEKVLESTKEISDNEWKESSISSEKIINKDVRRSMSLDISPSYTRDNVFFDFAKDIWNLGDFYGKKFNIGFSDMEPIQMIKYEEGFGHYAFHSDDGPGKERVFSIVLYLNTVDSGGETEFKYFKISNKPVKNTAIIFPASFSYEHRSVPPISSEKIVAVTWFKK